MSLVAWMTAALVAVCVGCASLPTLTERPEDYRLYRSSRVAPTLEERLRAADRYLREVGESPRRKPLLAWFEREEAGYYRRAFGNLPRLHAYLAALPQGPHAAEVEARIAALSSRSQRRMAARSRDDQRILDTQAQLARADATRREFVAALKGWVERLASIQTFGEPTSELTHQTIFAFRLSPPQGSCKGDACRKLMEFTFDVPAEGRLVSRVALLEVQLELERGLIRRARLAGPELWTRLGEALSLQARPNPSAAERTDALNRSSWVIRSVLEPVLPAAECDVKVEVPLVLERACRGLRVRVLAGAGPSDDDVLEVAPLAR